jgi:hypothetical protein
MTVNLTLSDTSGGGALPDTNDLGSVAANGTISAQNIYITHDAEVNPITDCTVYMERYNGSGGSVTDPDADLIQILGWGTGGTEGVKINMIASGSPSWSYFSNSKGIINSQLTLPVEAITRGDVVAGEISVGGEAKVQIAADIPAVPGTSGYKGFSIVFAYSATS